MSIVAKPQWFSKLSNFFSFSNNGLTTIDSGQLLANLNDYVEGHFGQLTSDAFISTMGSVLQPAVGSRAATSIFISNNNNAELVLGFGGIDYLAGTTQDNILQGGSGADYFGASAGIDLIIGSDETQSYHERDTIAYLMATSGIYVNATVDTSSIPPDLFPNQDIYSFNYADWLDASTTQRIINFQTGLGGDIVDLSGLLAEVGYTGTNPIADGYIKFSQSPDGLKIQFDPDGTGSISGRELVRFLGITQANFSTTYNLKVTASAPLTGEPNYLTYVSNDGQGAYDILYSVENIIGSRFDDTIYGHTILNNILAGAAGNDTLYGEGGADILIGGTGTDTVYGGTGNDLLLIGQGGDQLYGGSGIDSFKFDGTIGTSISANTSTIWDFQTGVGGDKIDVAEILLAAGYAGSNAVADGYVQIAQSGNDTTIKIDIDGAGRQAAQTLAILKNTNASQFSTFNNLVTTGTKTLYISILGQSNAEGLRVLGSDTDSGVTRIHSGILSQTDYNKVYVDYRDENGSAYVPAIGSTRVNGDYGGKPSDSWWYPSTNTPGEILVRAIEMMMTQIAEARASGVVKPIVVWGQGEGDCVFIGGQTTEAARLAAQTVYKNATLAIFDYIKAQLGADIQFYIMETGRYITQAGLNAGVSQSTIDRTQTGLLYIREAQEQMALERPDIFLATKYTDLPMNYEYDPAATMDTWHFHEETREIIGDRIADFISLSLGQDHILDNPGDYPLYMLADLTLKNHPGMTINGNANNNIVVGTLGNDILTGGAGNDGLYGGAGFDEVLYQGNYANYTLTVQSNGWINISDRVFFDGNDTLIGIERATFADGYYQNGVFTSTVENRNPVAQDDVFTALQNSVVTGNVLANNGNGVDTDADLDPLSVVAGTFATAHGSVTINANGTFTYTPSGGYAGVDTFNYTLVDGRGGSDIGNVSITLNVVQPNHNPVAADDIFVGTQDVNITGNVLVDNGNGPDSDIDLNPLSVVGGTYATAHGFVTIARNGGFTYTPNAGYFGTDTFNYTLEDGLGGSDIGTVFITVNAYVPPSNANPVAEDDAFTGLQNTNIAGNLLANNGVASDSDSDGGTLTVTAQTFATLHGSVTINANGTFLYTPTSGYNGLDRFNYTLLDGQGGSDLGSVVVIVVPSNVVSGTNGNNNMTGTAGNDVIQGLDGVDSIVGEDGNDILYGNAGNDTLKGRNGNDTMFGGDGVDYLEGGDGADVLYGGFGADTLKGSSGIDTFVYLLASEGGDTIQDFGATSGEKIDLSYVLVNAVGFQQAQAFTAGYLRVQQVGTNTALYLDMDGSAGSGAEVLLATLQGVQATNITLSSFILPTSGIAPNNPPVARDDAFTGNQNTVITGNVLSDNGYGADTDPDGNSLTVVSGTYATAHGSVNISTSGTFSYTPNAGYFGNDVFDYVLQDGHGGSDIGTVRFTVNPTSVPNNPPVAQDDAFIGNQNAFIAGNVLADNGNGVDTDPDGHALSVVAGTFATAHGSVTVNVNGTFTYTPNTGYFGTDTFNYTLQDGHGGSDIGAVSLTINQVIVPNNNPIAKNDDFSGNQDMPITGNVLADNGHGPDSDPDGHALNVVAGTFATTHGSVTIAANGTFTYTPNAGYFGADGFTYTLQDGHGGSATGNVTLALAFVPPTNHDPIAQDDVFVANQNTQILGNLLANNGNGVDSDPDGHPLNVVAGTYATAHGSVTILANGNFTYTPVTNYFGTDNFTYTLQDGQGGSDIGAVSLTINQSGIDDTFIGTAAVETFNGGIGNDTVDYSNSTIGVTIDLKKNTITGGFATGDTLISIENIIGSNDAAQRDTIYGDANVNRLYGMAGDDVLQGGMGADIIDGGAGRDYARYKDSTAGVNINLLTNVHSGGEAEGDLLYNIECIQGSNYNDVLRGGNGNDYLSGEKGNDLVTGGFGIDELLGGEGMDTFLFESASAFSGADRVRDFSRAQGDKIDISDLLSLYDENTHAITDFVRITDKGVDSYLEVDADGGGNGFITVAIIRGVTGLTDEQDLVNTGHLIV